MSQAGGLVAELAAAGIDPDLLSRVAQELFAAETERRILAERRQHERDRKARSRDNTGQAVTSGDEPGPPSPLSPPKASPTPPTNTPPLSPNPEAQPRPCLLKGIGLPKEIPAEPWLAFVRMRKAKDKGFTEDAARGAVRKLLKMAGQGFDPAKLLWRSVDNCWKGFFEHDDCRATKIGGQRDAAWHESQAKFFDGINRPDEAAEHRRKAVSIGQLAKELTSSGSIGRA